MRKLHLSGALFAALFAATGAHASWVGDVVQADDVYDFGGGWVYGGGYASTAVPGSATAGGNLYHFTVTDHQLVVELPLGGVGYGSAPFIGVVFTDISGNPLITNVTMTGNTGSATPALSFDSSDIWLNFTGLNGSSQQTFTYAISFADDPQAVPEPASWAMMVGGFGLMGAALRRKRTSLTFG